MDVCSPEFFDFWREVVARERWSVRHARRLRAVCRMFRAVVDAHARLHLDLGGRDDRFYRALPTIRWSPDGVVAPRPNGLPHNAFPTRALPSNVRSIRLNRGFNYVVDWAALPRTLEVLVFGNDFNQEVDATKLPPNLRELCFGKDFDQVLRGLELPRTLEKLRLRSRFYRRRDCPLTHGAPPPALTDVTLGSRDRWRTVATPPLAATVHAVRVVNDGQLIDGSIPATARHLRFGKHWHEAVRSEVLPPALRSLTFEGVRRSWPVVGDLPASLTHLELGDVYEGHLRFDALPPTLRVLRLGDSFCRCFNARSLPRSLTELALGSSYRTEISERHLPPGLTRLDVGSSMRLLLRVALLPPSLTDIRVIGPKVR